MWHISHFLNEKWLVLKDCNALNVFPESVPNLVIEVQKIKPTSKQKSEMVSRQMHKPLFLSAEELVVIRL